MSGIRFFSVKVLPPSIESHSLNNNGGQQGLAAGCLWRSRHCKQQAEVWPSGQTLVQRPTGSSHVDWLPTK